MKGADRHGAVSGLHAAGVHVHRVTLQRADDVLHGQPVGVQQCRVHGDDDLLIDPSLNVHLKHARHRLDRWRYLPLHDPEQLRNIPLTGYAQLGDRSPVRGQLEHAGLARVVRKPQAGYPTDDFCLSLLDIYIVFETGPHLGTVGPRRGRHFLETFHADDQVLDGLSDLLGHLVRRALLV